MTSTTRKRSSTIVKHSGKSSADPGRPWSHASLTHRVLGWVVLLLGAWAPPHAYAHRLSSASLQMQWADRGTRLTGQWNVALRDLATQVSIDADQDAAITWAELQAADHALQAYVLQHLKVVSPAQDAPLPLEFDSVAVDSIAGEPCAAWSFSVNLPEALSEVQIRYSLLFESDPDHRCLLRFQFPDGNASPITAVLGPDSPTFSVPLGQGDSGHPARTSMGAFIAEGVHHIWIGYDHILFLLALLLPSVARRQSGRFVVEEHFRTVTLQVLQVVTAFTVAHSITLGLAAFEILRLPSRWVETAIAASVAIAATNNLIPWLRDRTWQVAFGFGLIHGFGFAGVLSDLELPRSTFAKGVLGFNLGVEAGQLAIVAVFLPVAFALRHSWIYQRFAFQGGSVAIVGVATLWVAQRAFGF